VNNSTEIAARLEMIRSQTLASFEPVDKTKDAEDTQVLDVYDQTVGLESFQIQELPIENTRAGLYLYLNAAVS
jgi:mediator of RNA polymerase II transcription subunit 5